MKTRQNVRNCPVWRKNIYFKVIKPTPPPSDDIKCAPGIWAQPQTLWEVMEQKGFAWPLTLMKRVPKTMQGQMLCQSISRVRWRSVARLWEGAAFNLHSISFWPLDARRYLFFNCIFMEMFIKIFVQTLWNIKFPFFNQKSLSCPLWASIRWGVWSQVNRFVLFSAVSEPWRWGWWGSSRLAACWSWRTCPALWPQRCSSSVKHAPLTPSPPLTRDAYLEKRSSADEVWGRRACFFIHRQSHSDSQLLSASSLLCFLSDALFWVVIVYGRFHK